MEGVERSTRERLLEAAVEVFLEKGYTRTRVVDIARRADLTTGAIYANFDSKAALLTEAIVGDASKATLSTTRLPSGSPKEMAVALGIAMLSGESDATHRLMLDAWATALHEAEAAEVVRGAIDEAYERLDEMLAQAGDTQPLRDGVERDAYRTFLMAVFLGSVVLKALDIDRPGPGAVGSLFGALFDGMRAAPGNGGSDR